MRDIGDATDFMSLQLPLPPPISIAWLGDEKLYGDAPLPKAVYKFAGSLFWIGVVAGAMTAVHVPLLLLARARIRAMLADEDETKARINRLRRKQGLSEDHNTERRSARRPPDLWDSSLSTFPRYELWLCLLVFQGLAASSSAVLRTIPVGSPAYERAPWLVPAAAAALIALGAALVVVACFVGRHTRGAGANAAFVTAYVPLKEKKKDGTRPSDVRPATKRVQMWVDRPSYLGESAVRARSVYRLRTTVTGEVWTGFVARWGLAFASFRPADVSCGGGAGGGAPWGLCALLLHRTLVGLAIGALGGEARKVGQVIILMARATCNLNIDPHPATRHSSSVLRAIADVLSSSSSFPGAVCATGRVLFPLAPVHPAAHQLGRGRPVRVHLHLPLRQPLDRGELPDVGQGAPGKAERDHDRDGRAARGGDVASRVGDGARRARPPEARLPSLPAPVACVNMRMLIAR